MACFRALAAPLLAIAALGAGCLAEDEPTLGTTQGLGGGCSALTCGSNGPELNDGGFYELNEAGEPNDQGYQLDGIYFSGVKWSAYVVGNELRALKRTGLLVAYKTGTALVGGFLRVTGPSGTVYDILVDKVTTASLYPNAAPAGPSGSTWAYTLIWSSLSAAGGPRINLCTNQESLLGEQDTLFQRPFTAVLFDGQRYSAEKLEIRTDVSADKWFNIGCAGHILAKLHLTHHSPASSSGSFTTNDKERQSMMKMLAADYCGTGHAFTVAGQPLSWTDDHGWLPHLYDVTNDEVKLEARWDASGATCLETPRLEGTTDPDALAEFGPDVGTEIGSMIAAECALPPRCSSIESDDVKLTEGKHLVSGTPH